MAIGLARLWKLVDECVCGALAYTRHRAKKLRSLLPHRTLLNRFIEPTLCFCDLLFERGENGLDAPAYRLGRSRAETIAFGGV